MQYNRIPSGVDMCDTPFEIRNLILEKLVLRRTIAVLVFAVLGAVCPLALATGRSLPVAALQSVVQCVANLYL